MVTVLDIGLSLATEVLTAVQAEAGKQGLAVAAAVVDRGGHLVAAARMDNSQGCAMPLALDKAYTSAATQASTQEWSSTTQPGGPDWGFNSTMGGRIVVLAGGVPLVVDGAFIGGVGVSGGDAEQDHSCAAAGASVVQAAVA